MGKSYLTPKPHSGTDNLNPRDPNIRVMRNGVVRNLQKDKVKVGAPRRYNFDTLKPGESFMVALEDYQARNGKDRTLHNLENSLRVCSRAYLPAKFSVKCRDGVCQVTCKSTK